MDADGLTFACAMTVEERIARRYGRTALVGLGVSRGVPEGRLVSFGIAGALSGELPVGTVIDATRVVDEAGEVLWEGEPLGATPARTGTILGASRIIDDPEERTARALADEATAERIGDLGLEGFLRTWVAQPMFAGIPDEHQHLDERLANTVDGLASSLLLAGTGS